MTLLTIPLGNVVLDKPSIVGLHDARILPFDELELKLRDSITATFAKLEGVRCVDFGRPEFYLQMEVPELKIDEEARAWLDRALTTFKLFRDPPVLSSLVFMEKNTGIQYLHWRHYFHWRRVNIDPYSLCSGEEHTFQEFWKEFIQLDPGNFAIYRFHLADFRPYLRDRFADHVESLEYLLVPDYEKGKIGLRLRSRGAKILGKNSQKTRDQIFNELKDSYDLRSAIVHGDEKKEQKLRPRDELWEEKIRMIRQYNREAIKLLFRKGCLYDRSKRIEFFQNSAHV